MSVDSFDWKNTVLSDKYLNTVAKLAVRRFTSNTVAEEATSYVIDYLSSNNWQRCRQFQGNSNVDTFLYTLATNAIEEFARKRYGRVRPPVFLQNLGKSWVRLWQQLCLERIPDTVIVNKLCRNGFKSDLDVIQAIKYVKAKIPRCGEYSVELENVEDINAYADNYSSEHFQHTESITYSEDAYQREILSFLSSITWEKGESKLDRNLERENLVTKKKIDALKELKQSLNINEEEKLILQLVFVEGLSKTAASRAIGQPPHYSGRIVNSVLVRIRKALDKCHLTFDEIVNLI